MGSATSDVRLGRFVLAAVGALLLGAGAVAPWVTVGIPNESAHTTLRGTDLRDGVAVLVCALLCLGALVAGRVMRSPAARQGSAFVGGLAGALAASLALAFLIGGRDRHAVLSALGVPRSAWVVVGAFRDLRYGVYLVLVGAVLYLAGAVLTFRGASSEQEVQKPAT
jgi:uncharacterized membrane protein